MRCCVKKCNIGDDRFLWKCEFCDKRYHAACIGVQRLQENIITSFMIPLCEDCQHHLQNGIDTRKLLSQNEKLISSINAQTDAHLRIAADLKKLTAMGELFDQVELQLKESVSAINHNTANKVDSAVSSLSRDIEATKMSQGFELVDIKNHLTSLNISIEATKNRIENFELDLTTDLISELKRICDDVQNLSSVTMDMAANCNEHRSSQLPSTQDAINIVKNIVDTVSNDVLMEVKSLGNAISKLDNNIINTCLPTSPPSLMEELYCQSKIPAEAVTAGSWRSFPHKRVWKPQILWDDYDRRMKNRSKQEKEMDKAKRKRQKIKRRKYYNRQGDIDININSFSKSQEKVDTINITGNSPGGIGFQSDRDMLKAAKITFAGNSAPNHRPRQRFIAFNKGETLNPHKTTAAKTSTTSPALTVADNAVVSSTPQNFAQYNCSANLVRFNSRCVAHNICKPCRFGAAQTLRRAPLYATQDCVCNCNTCGQLNGENFLMY